MDHIQQRKGKQDKAKSWQAHLDLGYCQRGDKTVLKRRRQYGPLAIQRSFYPENGTCHNYILHPPGGIVGGDQLQMDVILEPQSQVLLTTPGATKFYRSNGFPAVQKQAFNIADETCLEWLPQETILFPATHAVIDTQLRLAAKARCITWDIICLGRPSLNERLTQGHVSARYALYRDDQPRFLEHFRLHSEQTLNASAGLRGYPVMATLLATPADQEILKSAQDYCQHLQNERQDAYLAVSLVHDVLVARYLGHSTEEVRQCFIHLWHYLRPLILHKEAVLPRIWAT